ncbi:flavin reductase domain protein FMN-binding protein [Fibrisoma limi BUZ 3]|uniref:Flavin reductase domain protein FMN-binding protein n=1 Tax=Fibrisoma limi BUZ 3 TaxID=1185876 RepID=I2GP73_9BACT|nr:flavin reductase family protein [Fibrisoma limi]CCH55701.1 flavin reductase domain protein FMN-binding protein [Fibrisoma limi BUZ 3]
MKSINPQDLSQVEFYRYLIGAIGPRPIAFASTLDAQGHVNLSPFSFFNVFGSNPPTLVFAPNINRHGHKKHTLLNLEEVGEVVINVVNYAMVEQMSLASAEYERGINEFEKSGFTPLPSEKVRPPRVAESPASFECIVKQIIETGTGPGAAHLIVCEVVMGHFHDDIFNEKGLIDPHKIDLIGRMGADWYARAHGDALFEVGRPRPGVGVDRIPPAVRNSNILSGNDLGKLGSVESLPTAHEVATYRASGVLDELFDEARYGCQYLPDLLHVRAKELLKAGKTPEAWLVLLQTEVNQNKVVP